MNIFLELSPSLTKMSDEEDLDLGDEEQEEEKPEEGEEEQQKETTEGEEEGFKVEDEQEEEVIIISLNTFQMFFSSSIFLNSRNHQICH